jgi:hypothetical protein
MAVFAPTMPGSVPQRGGFLRWIIAGSGLLILMLLFSFLSKLFQTGPVSCVPPQCRIPPPQQGPLPAPDHYTSSRYGFSLDYSPTFPPSDQTAASIGWDGTLGDGSEVSWSFTGGPANGKSAQQIVDDVQAANFPDAQQVYTIPGASLGYLLGYGNVYDVSVAPANGQAVQDRLVVLASIRQELVVVLVGLGPYEQSSPSSDTHPNPAATPLVHLGEFEESVNSVIWPGEPPL